ncbi:MAG: hypothetical protein IJQ84_00400 [Paludibacteraceae bacterium]|nr:hypothetical protein [Paludibacteraceae bacterium]
MYPKAHDNISSKDDTIILTELAKTVYYWLNYINSVSRTELLLESSLRYPISEFTERRLHQNCFLEIQHPHFETRPMDFVWLENVNIANFDPKIFCKGAFVMECKCAAYGMNTPHQRQEIFDDLCRLYFVLNNCPTAHALFMMAGEKKPFTKQFEKSQTRTPASNITVNTDSLDIKIEDVQVNDIEIEENKIEIPDNKSESTQQEDPQIYKSAYKDWFKFDLKNPVQEINTSDIKNKSYFETFVDTYKLSTSQDINFQTRLISYIHQDEDASINMQSSQVVAIWQVELCDEKGVEKMQN